MKKSPGNNLVAFVPESAHQFPGKFCWPGPGPGFGCFHGDTTKRYRKSNSTYNQWNRLMYENSHLIFGAQTRHPSICEVFLIAQRRPLCFRLFDLLFIAFDMLHCNNLCSYLSPFLDGRNKILRFSVSIRGLQRVHPRPRLIKRSPLWWSKSHPLPVFLNNVLLVHSQAHLCTYCLWWLCCYNGSIEWLQQRMYDSQNLSYSLSSPALLHPASLSQPNHFHKHVNSNWGGQRSLK